MPATFVPKKYQTNPTEVEAVVFPGGHDNALPIIDWVNGYRGHATWNGDRSELIVDTYGTPSNVPPGHVVVYDYRWFRVLAPETFKRLYRHAPTPDPTYKERTPQDA